MQHPNPYETIREELTAESGWRRSGELQGRLLSGLMLGALIPVGYGCYGIYQHQIQLSTLGPDEGVCGMGMLVSLGWIFPGGPFGGLIGGSILAAAKTDIER